MSLYQIHLPTGAYIEFLMGEFWINLHLYGASDDWRATMGLCGTFDGDKYNDFLHPDGVTQSRARDHDACGEATNVCDFAESWRFGSHFALVSSHSVNLLASK